MIGPDISLSQLEYLATQDVAFQGAIRRWTVQTYGNFLDVLYDDLSLVIEQLETNCQQYPLDENEDATTQRIVDMLAVMGYSANHNAASGGNVDITVELTRKRWKWIAEAKRFNSTSDLRAGYLQLATRYRPGLPDKQKAHAGLLGYLRRPKASRALTNWQEALRKMPEASGSTFDLCTRRGPMAFYSEHEHEVMGVPFRVWHVCIALHFDPKDKSGLTAKKYKKLG